MDGTRIARLAAFLAEAFETGNPVAPLPPELVLPDREAGEAVAGAVLERLGFAPCGLRVAPGPDGAPVAGPMLEGRLLRSGAVLPHAVLPHARISAAVIAVLAEPLVPGEDAPPRLAALLPALDIAVSRLRDGAPDAGTLAADLGGLGHVVAGRRGAPDRMPSRAACAAGAARARGVPVAIEADLAAAARAARALGGLPAGGLLVIAGLTPGAAVRPGQEWRARLTPLGQAEVRIS